MQVLITGIGAECEGREGASRDSRAQGKTGAICTLCAGPLLRSHITFQALDDVSRSFIEDLKERERETEAHALQGNCVKFCTV